MDSRKIQVGSPKDLDQLENLYNELNDYLESTINYPGWIKYIYPVRETAAQAIEKGSLFLIRENNHIIGSIILNHEPEDAYNQVDWGVNDNYLSIFVVHTLVIHPKLMNKGIAKQLLFFAEELASKRKIRSIRLDVSIHNFPAIALYEKMNYVYRGTVDLGLGYEHLKWFRLYEKIL